MATRIRIRSRLIATIVVLVGLVLASGAATFTVALLTRRGIASARALEIAARRAALLSVVAREQYIHEAHTIIVRDRSHVEHHDAWARRLARDLAELRGVVDEAGARRLDSLSEASNELLIVFSDRILPGVDRQDWEAVRLAHDQATELVDRMTREADALAASFDERADDAEVEANRVATLGRTGAFVLALLACAIGVAAARNLWRSFSSPLDRLQQVAARIAAGDRDARVGAVEAVELEGVVATFHRMLEALERAEATVVASERLATVGRIAAGVAHEINNPIAVIRGYLQTMLEETGPVDRKELAILDEEAGACQRIAEDLLVYAKSPTLVRRSIEVSLLIEEAVTKVRARHAGLRVEVDVEPATLWVDSVRLQQVIGNLVANAFEASGPDTPIEVRGRAKGGGYLLEVLDRGKGFRDDERERIFEPFFTTRSDGTGLGLAVCYGLVRAHDGTLRAEAREGGGAALKVDLPATAVVKKELEP